MPRYAMTRKLWSLAGAFDIRDVDRGVDCFRVRGKLLSVADQLRFEDMQGRELAFIRQEIGLRGLRYDIVRNGQPAATVQTTSAFRQRLEIQTSDGVRLDVTGDIIGMNYQIAVAGSPVASISTGWRLGGGTYHVDISPGQDQVLLLAAAVAIEMIHHHEASD